MEHAIIIIIIITVRTAGSPAGTRSMAAPMGAVKAMAIIIITKTRALELLASTGYSTLNREATMHAQ